MTEPSLQQQAISASGQAQAVEKQLKPQDPFREWFSLELRKLEVKPEDPLLPLEEANARLGAIRQLLYGIRDHCIRLQNPDYESPAKNYPDSFLTIQARDPTNVLNSARELGFTIEPSLLHDPAMANDQFDPVSPTAKVVAYLRGLDRSLNIKTEFTPEIDGLSLLNELGINDPSTQSKMAVLFQSRYHAMNVAMAGDGHDAKQIIEFASGISPRGYQWAQMSPGTIYVESDLPQLMIHKAKLIRNEYLQGKQKAKGVHHCCAADVLNQQSIQTAIENLDTNFPFTVVTEGLLLYFGEEELTKFFCNVQNLLQRFPGARWVTDFVSQSNLRELFDSDADVAKSVKSVFAKTDREVVPQNPFKTEDCILQWLEKFGMQVESTVSLRSVTDTVRLQTEVAPSIRNAVVGTRKVWNICCKPS